MFRFFLNLMCSITKKITILVMVLIALMTLASASVTVLAQGFTQEDAQENIQENATSNAVNRSPLVIESQVKGSQEQPNVIYIMPWQGIENPVIIEGGKQKINMPHFKPINPKQFKQKSSDFYHDKVNKQKSALNTVINQ